MKARAHKLAYLGLAALLLTPLALPQAQADSAYCAAPAAAVTPATPPIGDIVLSEYNMVLGRECSTFAPLKDKGDIYGFVQATRQMLNHSRSCLRAQGLVEPLARFEAILKPGATATPIQLVCGNTSTNAQVKVHDVSYAVTDVAAALTPNMAGYPGVIFNMDWANKSGSRSFKAAFMHELFHAAGYDHVSGVDYAYFAAGCCFEDSAAACNLLRRSLGKDPLWWTSEDYLKDAIAWLDGRDGVAADLLTAASVAAGRDQRGVLTGLLTLSQNRASRGAHDAAINTRLRPICLAAGGGDKCQKAFPLK